MSSTPELTREMFDITKAEINGIVDDCINYRKQPVQNEQNTIYKIRQWLEIIDRRFEILSAFQPCYLIAINLIVLQQFLRETIKPPSKRTIQPPLRNMQYE